MKSLKGRSVAIVGAGVSGLVAGYHLRKAGADVTVFERNDYAGGRTRSVRKGEFTFDVGALVMLPTYQNVYHLIKELGLEKHVHNTKPRLGIMREGKLHSLDYERPLRSALFNGIISWRSKIKLLKLLPTLARYWSKMGYVNMDAIRHLDGETTAAFCLRELNEEINDYIADPFIRINSLTDTDHAPIGEFIWLIRAYNSPHIFQLDQGMVFYAETLARHLNVELNTAVVSVENRSGRIELVTENHNDPKTHQTLDFDACILAVPPPFARAISTSTTPEQERYFADVEPVKMVSLHIGLNHRPDIKDSIIMFPKKEHADILDILLDHNKGPGRAPAGKSAIAVQMTIEWSAAQADASDDEIRDKILAMIEPYLGDVRQYLEVFHVNRWDYVCAVTHPGYFELLYQFRKNRDMNQPLFYAGDFYSGGIEGATVSGINASKDVSHYLTGTAFQPISPTPHKEEIL